MAINALVWKCVNHSAYEARVHLKVPAIAQLGVGGEGGFPARGAELKTQQPLKVYR